jgi:hypothetical protein
MPKLNLVSTTLQRATSLGAPQWTEVTNVPVLNLTNLQNQVTVPWGGKVEFYRLREN